MSRWALVERPVLARRLAWAAALSAIVHAALLGVIELPDGEKIERADWPQVDVRLVKLAPRALPEKPAVDAPPPPALVPEMLEAAAVTQGGPPGPKKQASAKAMPSPAPQPAIIMAEHQPVPPGPDGGDGASLGSTSKAGAPIAAAGQGAASAFPRALELEYSVQEAERETVLGWMVYRFERDGDRYRIRAAIDAIGVASFFIKGRYEQRSEGRLTEDGLQPERFMVRRGRRERVEHASFDWPNLRATLSGAEGVREWVLQPGAQDQLSLVYQISYLMDQRDPPKILVTDGRRFETAQIALIGRETVDTELGPMQTVHLRSDLGRGAQIELWLAPDFGYLPARLRLRDKRGRAAEQVLASVKVKW